MGAARRGSEVRGRVTEAVPSGRVKTRARLAFDFDTLVLEGKEYSIGSGPVDITAGSTHKKEGSRTGHRNPCDRQAHPRDALVSDPAASTRRQK